MKGKYITHQLMMACLSNQPVDKKDIHAELEKTINERKEILKKLEAVSRKADTIRMYLNYSSAA